MRRIGFGKLAALLVVSACAGETSRVPAARVLTPDGSNHILGSYSPDGRQMAYWTPSAEGYALMVSGANLDQAHEVAVSPDQTGIPVWSPDGGQLAFASSAAGIADVWVVGADGSGLRRLTEGPGLEFPIMWHRTGARIGYLATTEGGTYRTFSVDLASGRSTPMIAEPKPAVAFWSPDGSRIAYVMYYGGASTLWLADSTGNNPRQLTTEGLEDIECCSYPWSPDGTTLVYTSRRTGTGDIWALPVDGGAPRQLTHDVRGDNHGAWSPDGKWIAFRSDRGRQTDVWVVPAAGGEEIRVTDDPVEEASIQWIPGSNTVVYEMQGTAQALWALSPDDGKERRITPDSIRVGEFDVSSDGGRIVYRVLRGGGVSDLQVVPVAGGAASTLVAGSADNLEPYWSPKGERVLFQSNRSGNPDLWLVDPAGGEPRQLTDWPTAETDAEWGGDGSIYFQSDREASPFADVWRIAPDGGAPRRLTTVGNINGLEPSRATSDLFVTSLGSRAGEILLNRVLPDGKLAPVWDRSNVFTMGHRAMMPKGDSLAIGIETPGGGRAAYLVPARGGEGRVILPSSERIGPISPNGDRMVYLVGSQAASDLGILSLRDGTFRQLTKTPENENSPQWAAGGSTVVFRRETPRNRIAKVDLAQVLSGGR